MGCLAEAFAVPSRRPAPSLLTRLKVSRGVPCGSFCNAFVEASALVVDHVEGFPRGALQWLLELHKAKQLGTEGECLQSLDTSFPTGRFRVLDSLMKIIAPGLH